MNVIRFTPNGLNRTPEVVEALAHAPEGTLVQFEKGVYDFYADGAYENVFYPACNRSGTKRVIFPLLRLKDVTIDGSGSEFIFHDRVFPFIAQNCKNVTFRNFSVDFSFSRCCVCNVIAASEEGVELSFDGSGCDWDVSEGGNLVFRAGRDTFSTCEQFFSMIQPNVHVFLAAGERFYDFDNKAAKMLICTVERTGNGVYLRYSDDTEIRPDFVPGQVKIMYDNKRWNDVFFFDRTDDVLVEDVRIYHGAGMGVVGQLCDNIRLHRYVVAPPEGSGDIYSTTADTILLSNCTGRVEIDHCRIEYPLDDVMSVHGFYTVVERITAPNKIRAKLMHISHAGYSCYAPGDVLTISGGPALDETGFVTVKSARFDDDPYVIFLEFEEDVRGLLQPGDYLENPARTPEVSVTNCLFSDFPAIRLSSAKPMRFEKNVVRRGVGVLINDLIQFWYASGRTNGVTIADNLFEETGGIRTIMERPEETTVRHKNITITGNRFVNCSSALHADAVDGLVFRDNILENSGGVTLRRCENTDIQEL